MLAKNKNIYNSGSGTSFCMKFWGLVKSDDNSVHKKFQKSSSKNVCIIYNNVYKNKYYKIHVLITLITPLVKFKNKPNFRMIVLTNRLKES